MARGKIQIPDFNMIGTPSDSNSLRGDGTWSSFGKRVTASITGTYNIDWNAGDTFVLTVTGNVTISNTNLPTGTNTKTIEVEIKGNFAVTLPTTWTALPSSQTYSATKWNHYVVSCINGTTSSENIKYANEVEAI